MKNIILIISALLCTCSSFAINPTGGPSSVCVGSSIMLADATTGYMIVLEKNSATLYPASGVSSI